MPPLRGSDGGIGFATIGEKSRPIGGVVLVSKGYVMQDERPEVVVPEEATKRGDILRGELRSSECRIPGILAQFSKLTPHDKEANIYFYPTLAQAKALFVARPPFTFEGSVQRQDGVDEHFLSTEIWLKHGSKITHHDSRYYTHCSGVLANLRVTVSLHEEPSHNGSRRAWFVTNRCFLLQGLATPDGDGWQVVSELDSKHPVHKFVLSDGAIAEFKSITSRQSPRDAVETRHIGYAIGVDGVTDSRLVKRDVDRLLILASLASRERSQSWFWSMQESKQEHRQQWQFGFRKWPPRRKGEEPLLPRDANDCKDFLTATSNTLLNSKDGDLIEAAVYALLETGLPLETRIVRLVTGIQSALRFAVPHPKKGDPPKIYQLLKAFASRHCIDLTDLWPLSGKRSAPTLCDIRNAVVHGGVFGEREGLALSVAAENLQWTLERVLLTALGWDVQRSDVSPASLRKYTAYSWKQWQQSLKL